MRRKILCLLFTIAMSATAAAKPVSGTKHINTKIASRATVNQDAMRAAQANRVAFITRSAYAAERAAQANRVAFIAHSTYAAERAAQANRVAFVAHSTYAAEREAGANRVAFIAPSTYAAERAALASRAAFIAPSTYAAELAAQDDRVAYIDPSAYTPDTTADEYADDDSPALDRAASTILSATYDIASLLVPPIIEKSCMATAVYFEARSESMRGQRAVAAVILNRVKSPHYPSSVCAVVYQGASRLNSCQFSFACDGKPDLARNARAWKKALAVAAMALNDNGDGEIEDAKLRKVSKATHYHADYVRPRWSRSLTRLTKIGHHIFYSQG